MYSRFNIEATVVYSIYQWCISNRYTPCILFMPSVNNNLPDRLVRLEELVINLSRKAVQKLTISNEALAFSSSFSGLTHNVKIWFVQLAAVYGLEVGNGVTMYSYPFARVKRATINRNTINSKTNFKVTFCINEEFETKP
ncbi:Stringent starvation protein B [Candidatus Tremblaya phenacola]|uniref:Stringent starvation protein B n=2 Tax=Candidatus Tremblayella phenacoccinincola TaxID=1010676 RepID=A0A2G0V779_9PROT|nr:Stringent starvation protein B [Candidatus Tremblaya phenacola]